MKKKPLLKMWKHFRPSQSPMVSTGSYLNQKYSNRQGNYVSKTLKYYSDEKYKSSRNQVQRMFAFLKFYEGD